MTHQITVSDHLWGKIQRVSCGLNLPPEDVMAIAMDHYIHHEQEYEAHDHALVPNAETRKAMEDVDKRIGLSPPMTLEAFFAHLESSDIFG
ncbi:MAG: hypothetical protein ACKO57_08330 [Alphaproteobacteria bacterium]